MQQTACITGETADYIAYDQHCYFEHETASQSVFRRMHPGGTRMSVRKRGGINANMTGKDGRNADNQNDCSGIGQEN